MKKEPNIPTKLELRSILERIRQSCIATQQNNKANTTPKKELSEIIINQGILTIQNQNPICPMPTDLCRTSPFFPLNNRVVNLSKNYIEKQILIETSWGRITYMGPQLSSYDEDVLIALLTLLDNKSKRREITLRGSKTYTYRGSILSILRVMALSDQGKNYSRIKTSLDRLASTILKLEIFKRDKDGQRQIAKWRISPMLACVQWEDSRPELTVTLNPYFYETYIQGNVTRLDILRREAISAPIAKSLYRFILSHRNNRWQGNFLTLSSALNLNNRLPNFKKRERICKAIDQLIQMNILSNQSGFKKEQANNIVLLVLSKKIISQN